VRSRSKSIFCCLCSLPSRLALCYCKSNSTMPSLISSKPLGQATPQGPVARFGGCFSPGQRLGYLQRRGMQGATRVSLRSCQLRQDVGPRLAPACSMQPFRGKGLQPQLPSSLGPVQTVYEVHRSEAKWRSGHGNRSPLLLTQVIKPVAERAAHGPAAPSPAQVLHATPRTQVGSCADCPSRNAGKCRPSGMGMAWQLNCQTRCECVV
jgi:hypothetical protein